ncbi:hypothetical protein [Streptomyces chiangmaiensis]|uniref:Uncharacterized protein n=1 Tax=Streptomyces chiangmaiensis TaxID=766497 RepID=A0ABU7FXN5_9ACTN|nr:hypothetical protein [Streptomyces chiangmaiensis]MED7828735.1 hypothetical protein [Streptomyces chiangmaiensis]
MSTRGREPLSLEKGLAEPEDAVPVAWDASRPRLRERFTRRQLAMRAAWAVGGLLIVYAAVAFLAKGMWVEASVLWVGPIFWVIAWETALSTVEFWSVKKPHRARLVPARYVRTERRAQRFVQAYRLRTDDSEEVLWRRDSGDSPDLAALPTRRLWLVPGEKKADAESTAGFVFLLFFGLFLLCLSVAFALVGVAAAGFYLVGPWLI